MTNTTTTIVTQTARALSAETVITNALNRLAAMICATAAKCPVCTGTGVFCRVLFVGSEFRAKGCDMTRNRVLARARNTWPDDECLLNKIGHRWILEVFAKQWNKPHVIIKENTLLSVYKMVDAHGIANRLERHMT